MKLLKRFLSLFIVLLLLCSNSWASNQLVASGTCTQANMRISAVNGGAEPSGGAFVDFGAADVLTDYLGNLLVIKDSLGHSIQGHIKAAGTGETITELISLSADDRTFASDTTNWTRGENWAIGSGVATRTAGGGASGLSYSVTGATVGKLIRFIYSIPSLASGSYRPGFNLEGIGDFDVTGTGITKYYTLTANDSATSFYSLDSGGFTVDDVSIGILLTPSSTGVTITSLKGGSLYNWSAKDTAFNYNDASGYTYRIYKTPPVLVAGPTAVTAANTQLSMVNPAFAYFVGTDLTAYQTGKYLLAVYNATSNILIGMGYISATPPAGESLDVELLTNPSFDANVTGWTANANNTFVSSHPAGGGQVDDYGILTQIDDVFPKATQTIASLTVGALYKASGYGKQGTKSGDQAVLAILKKDQTAQNGIQARGVFGASWTLFTGYGNPIQADSDAVVGQGLYIPEANATMFFDEVSLKQVTDPPSTGCRIINAKGTGTQVWLTTGAGALNAAINYKIYLIGD